MFKTVEEIKNNTTHVDYNPVQKTVTFYTKFKGYIIPFSQVLKDLGDFMYLTPNLDRLEAITGITPKDIIRGQQCIH